MCLDITIIHLVIRDIRLYFPTHIVQCPSSNPFVYAPYGIPGSHCCSVMPSDGICSGDAIPCPGSDTSNTCVDFDGKIKIYYL